MLRKARRLEQAAMEMEFMLIVEAMLSILLTSWPLLLVFLKRYALLVFMAARFKLNVNVGERYKQDEDRLHLSDY